MMKHVERVFHNTSQTHGQTRRQLFVYNYRTHYSNCHLAIFHDKIDSVQSVIIFLLDLQNNVLIVFFYTCRSAQLNMSGRIRESECIKCLISKMRMRLPMICFQHSVTKGFLLYVSRNLDHILSPKLMVTT